jgi:hypothetical protein
VGESPAGVTPAREITLVRVEGTTPVAPARQEAVWSAALASDFPDLFDLSDLSLPSLLGSG